MRVRTVIEIAHVQGGAIEMLAVIFSSPPLTEGTYLHSLTRRMPVLTLPPPFILPSPSSPTNWSPPSPRENKPLFSSWCHQPPNNNTGGASPVAHSWLSQTRRRRPQGHRSRQRQPRRRGRSERQVLHRRRRMMQLHSHQRQHANSQPC